MAGNRSRLAWVAAIAVLLASACGLGSTDEPTIVSQTTRPEAGEVENGIDDTAGIDDAAGIDGPANETAEGDIADSAVDGPTVTLDDVPIGTTGGQAFCDADTVWRTVMTLAADAPEGAFLEPFIRSAEIYTKWGERMPVDVAVRTVEMNVGYAQVVATFGNTQDVDATRQAFLEWRSGASHASGRAAVDSWITQNCAS